MPSSPPASPATAPSSSTPIRPPRPARSPTPTSSPPTTTPPPSTSWPRAVPSSPPSSRTHRRRRCSGSPATSSSPRLPGPWRSPRTASPRSPSSTAPASRSRRAPRSSTTPTSLPSPPSAGRSSSRRRVSATTARASVGRRRRRRRAGMARARPCAVHRRTTRAARRRGQRRPRPRRRRRHVTYPVAENVHRDGILDLTVVPARVDPAIALEAQRLADANRRGARLRRRAGGRDVRVRRPVARQRVGAASAQQRALDARCGADEPVRPADPGRHRGRPRGHGDDRTGGGDGQPARRPVVHRRQWRGRSSRPGRRSSPTPTPGCTCTARRCRELGARWVTSRCSATTSTRLPPGRCGYADGVRRKSAKRRRRPSATMGGCSARRNASTSRRRGWCCAVTSPATSTPCRR